MPTVTSNTFTVPASSGGGSVLDLPLYNPSTVSYLGNFAFANTLHSGNCTGKGKDANTMYTSGGNVNSSQKLRIGIQSIPALGGQATSIAAAVPIPGTFWPSSCSSAAPGGFLYVPEIDRILTQKWCNYDGASENKMVSSCLPDLTSFTDPQMVTGLFSGTGPRGYTGFMASVPTEWRTLLGGDVILAGGPKSAISGSAAGMGAVVIDSSEIGSGQDIPGNALFCHDYSSQEPEKWFALECTQVNGCCIVPGTRTLLFFGFEGQMNEFNYGSYADYDPAYGIPGDDLPSAADPCETNKGFHSYPYRATMWAYDMRDVVDAMNGTIPSYQPRPYNFTGVGTDAGGAFRNGLGTGVPGPLGAWGCPSTYRGRSVEAFHDPDTNRFYLTPRNSSSTCYVFQL